MMKVVIFVLIVRLLFMLKIVTQENWDPEKKEKQKNMIFVFANKLGCF